ARRGEPSAARARLRARARHRAARQCGRAFRPRRRRVSRLHPHRLQPSGDVARHLPRQPRPDPRGDEALPRRAFRRRGADRGGAGRGAREAFRRRARGARRMDSLELKPAGRAAGVVRLPGSKSLSNRILLLAALARGTTEVAGLLEADDTQVMREALSTLGVRFGSKEGRLLVDGVNGAFPVKKAELFLGNAGTAFRPLTAALALSGGEYRLSGVPRMHERPIGDLVDGLRGIGARIDYLGNEGYPPLAVHPATIDVARPVRVKGDVSSQFLTALLMALPISGKEARIEVQGELISKPYVEITLEVMRRFGLEVAREDWRAFRVPAGEYLSPGGIRVEGDASSASYFLAAGAIGGGGPALVEGVGRVSVQGDGRFSEVLERMGAQVSLSENAIEVQNEKRPLRALDMDLNHIPDAAMTAAVLALFAAGPSTLRNIDRKSTRLN